MRFNWNVWVTVADSKFCRKYCFWSTICEVQYFNLLPKIPFWDVHFKSTCDFINKRLSMVIRRFLFFEIFWQKNPDTYVTSFIIRISLVSWVKSAPESVWNMTSGILPVSLDDFYQIFCLRIFSSAGWNLDRIMTQNLWFLLIIIMQFNWLSALQTNLVLIQESWCTLPSILPRTN